MKKFTILITAVVIPSLMAAAPPELIMSKSAPPKALRISTEMVRNNDSSLPLLQRSLWVKGATSLSRPPTQAAIDYAPTQTQFRTAPVVAQRLPNLKGSVIYANSWNTTGAKIGMYSISLSRCQLIKAGIDATNGGEAYNGKYFCANSYLPYYKETALYDMTDWSAITSNSSPDVSSLGFELAAHPVTGIVYGCFYNESGSGFEIGTIDMNTGVRTSTICPITTDEVWYGADFKADGTLYVLRKQGDFGTIDLKTGAFTKLADTGIVNSYVSSGAYDNSTGIFYQVLCSSSEAALFAIDCNDGYAVSKIGDLPDGEQIVGMFIDKPLAADDAPDYVSDITLDFAPGSLKGTVSFTAPASTFNGTPMTGTLDYTVMIDETVAAEGSVVCGTRAEAEVSVATSGEHSFVVYVTNKSGQGPLSDPIEQWIGNDRPDIPGFVTAIYNRESSVMTINWEAVTDGVNGGYLDPAGVTYTVTRMADGEVQAVIAEGIKECRVEENLPEPESLSKISYMVVADFNGQTSEPGVSAVVLLGYLPLPFEESFAGSESADIFTIIDNNADKKTWKYNPVIGAATGVMRIEFNSALDMDDYIVTPAIRLEAGKLYSFSMNTYCQTPKWAETIEVKLGEEPTAEGLNITLIEPTAVDQPATSPINLSTMLQVEKTGRYYIGIHGMSNADRHYLYVDDISLSAPFAPGAPDNVTDVEFHNRPDGTHKVDISFTAPCVNVFGKTITSLSKITVARDGEIIKTFHSPTFGSRLELTDAVEKSGEYKYTITPYNEKGEGRAYQSKVFVGVGLGAAPTDATVVEDPSNPGVVTVSWTPTAKDINGNDLTLDNISYVIIDRDMQTVSPQIPASEPTYTFRAVGDNKQQFVYYFIIPVTEAGANTAQGGYALTGMIPVGTPYEMPVTESFVGGGLAYAWGTYGDGEWGVASSLDDVTPQDADGGFMVWKPSHRYDTNDFMSAKITVTDANYAAFSFYYYCTGYDDFTFVPVISVDGGEAEPMCPQFTTADGEEGWNRMTLSLASYAGKAVRVGVRAICEAYYKDSFFMIDNIEIRPFAEHDVAVTAISAPSVMHPEMISTVKATVKNYGSMDAGSFNVELIRDGESVETLSIESLAIGKTTDVEFSQTPGIFWPESVTYQVKVNYNNDVIASNDISDKAVSGIEPSGLPAVKNLKAEVTDNSDITLTWDRPAVESYGEVITEDVEKYPSFNVDNAGDWRFIDGDGQATYPIEDIDMPNAGYIGAYIILDEAKGLNPSFATNSGTKCFACFSTVQGRNDDWLVSPELPGIAQTISFYARSYSLAYGSEEFEFLYSTTTPEASAFIRIAEVKNLSNEWTLFSYDIPQGARYFAIRCVSNDRFIFMVDDISYILNPEEITLKGYDVYRDCVKINSAPVTQTNYTDPAIPEGSYTYHVVAVYEEGISALSNGVTTAMSSIDTLTARGITVSTKPSTIIISGAAGMDIDVYNVNGVRIRNAVGRDITHFEVTPGIYMVKIGGSTVKAIVR